MGILTEWRHLHMAVGELERDLQATSFPLPSRRMQALLVAGEDRRLGRHPGLDVIQACTGLLRAMLSLPFHATALTLADEGGCAQPGLWAQCVTFHFLLGRKLENLPDGAARQRGTEFLALYGRELDAMLPASGPQRRAFLDALDAIRTEITNDG